MERLIEFAGNHPYLVAAAVFMVILVIVSEMRSRIQDFAAIPPHDAVRLMNQGALLLDVREAAQYEAGHIGEARHLPLKEVAGSAESLKKFRDKPVVTYCDSGMNGGVAARELRKLGFSKVFNLRGGLNAWRHENLPVIRSAKAAGGKAEGKA
jgi:rhodanese-related sulfurtransferase